MRQFDVAQANQLVPYLADAFEKVRAWTGRARELTAGLEKEPTASKERDELVETIRQELVRISELGIEVKSLDGLVDFRAQREGRPVFLCWRFGEEQVGFWHEQDAGFGGRRRIDRPEAFAPSYLC